MFKFLWDEETASKVVENRNKFPWLDKFENAGNAMSNLLRTRQLGSYVESMARGTIYQRHVKLLEDVAFDDLARIYGKDAALDTIKKEASRITNEVFYDYGKMSYWERTYARQVIPFYSFYRQNLFYQGQVLFDPKRAKNAAALGRLAEGRYFGADPFTGKDKIFVPEYLKGQSAIRFTDENGEEKIYYSPSDPGQMMYTMLSSKYWFKDFMGQFNPALKSLIEQLSNTDFFRGEPLDPAMLSADPNRQLKFLFSQGYTMMPIYNTVAALLGSKDSVVWPDKNGNPVTDQEWVARVDNIMSWLGAQYLTATKQMYGAAKKMEHGKATGFDTLMNLAGPMSVTRQIESQKERAIDAYYQEKVYGDGYGEQLRRTNRLID